MATLTLDNIYAPGQNPQAYPWHYQYNNSWIVTYTKVETIIVIKGIGLNLTPSSINNGALTANTVITTIPNDNIFSSGATEIKITEFLDNDKKMPTLSFNINYDQNLLIGQSSQVYIRLVFHNNPVLLAGNNPCSPTFTWTSAASPISFNW